MTTTPRMLRSNEPLAVELRAALKQGEVERLSRLLAAESRTAGLEQREQKADVHERSVNRKV